LRRATAPGSYEAGREEEEGEEERVGLCSEEGRAEREERVWVRPEWRKGEVGEEGGGGGRERERRKRGGSVGGRGVGRGGGGRAGGAGSAGGEGGGREVSAKVLGAKARKPRT